MSNDIRKTITIALLSSSTTQLFAGCLKNEMRNWGWEVRVWESAFNHYRQDIANPRSRLYEEQPDAVMLYLEAEDIFADCMREPFAVDHRARGQRACEAAAETEGWANLIQQQLPTAIVILNTIAMPPIHTLTGLEYHSPWGLTDLAAQYNLELARVAGQHPNLLIQDVAALMTQIGYRHWFDPRLWYLARTRLSSAASKQLARSTASLLRAWKGHTRKCIALDLDNTLWGGIIGEDGLEGIELGDEGLGLAYAEFQQELANLERKGVLLAICSKNDEHDALEVLRLHPSMRLREAQFAAMRINWEDKAKNLKALASTLNIGLDSIVFIDDNPVEREFIRLTIPEVLVPDWPRDPSDYKAALLDLAVQHFPRISLTKEDPERTAMYQAEARRLDLAATTSSLEDYYRSLQMRAEIGLADDSSIPRIAQLTQKTNQFNLTTRRYTESEIRNLARAANALIFWSRLRDQISDNGIVGVLLLMETRGSTWNIETFLLSCRVIGRKLEAAFLGCATQYLLERGAKVLTGEYRPTKKNGVAASVYGDLGFDLVEEDQGTTRWRLALKDKVIAMPEWIQVEFHEGMMHA